MLRSLRERFAALKAQVEHPAPQVVDQRSRAKRLQLRIGSELHLQLCLIRLAAGGSTNKFCETAIAAAAAQRIHELRAQHSLDSWEALVAAAYAARHQGFTD
jgi:hypothetical protein